jgi:hypothetical protein
MNQDPLGMFLEGRVSQGLQDLPALVVRIGALQAPARIAENAPRDLKPSNIQVTVAPDWLSPNACAAMAEYG